MSIESLEWGCLILVIERLDETRLFVLLEQKDMEYYDITFEQPDWHDCHSRQIVRELLTLAQEETGFSVLNKKLLIEVMPERENCLILFTLLPKEEKKGRRIYKIKEESQTVVYEFRNVENALSAIERLYKQGGINGGSRLFLTNGCYQLILSPKSRLPEKASVLLSEYGKKRGRAKSLCAIALEHGKLLAGGNAIEQIGQSLC